ncbi:MAG: PadR family transcriptional regulator [Sporolactobacillus sp.]
MARKNLLKYILLGLLSKKERTGYDLEKIFEEEIGEFWQANHSQIYPELRKLEEGCLVCSRIEIVGSKLEKKYYSLTANGAAELEAWIRSSTPELAATKDEFILKLYFVRHRHQASLQKMFEEQIDLHAGKTEHLKQRNKLVFPTEKERNENYGHYLILDHAIAREENYLLWLRTQYDQLH